MEKERTERFGREEEDEDEEEEDKDEVDAGSERARMIIFYTRRKTRGREEFAGYFRVRERTNVVSPANVSIITRSHYQRCATNMAALESARSLVRRLFLCF